MMMKPKIFIASATEGLNVAKYVMEQLSAEFDCVLWSESFSTLNESFLESLSKGVFGYDFGVMIATKDDHVSSSRGKFEKPRDNVVFELGLFIGNLGRFRAFALQENDATLPSDLLGITVPRFERTDDISKSETLNSTIHTLKDIIKERVSLNECGLLPSTALAIGYFDNFIAPLCEALQAKGIVNFDNHSYSQFKIFVMLPHILDVDMTSRAAQYIRTHSLKHFSIDRSGGARPLSVATKINDKESEILSFYDMPTTLSVCRKAIEMCIGKTHIGKGKLQQELEERELRNFYNTLNQLISDRAVSRGMVELIFTD